MAPPSNDKIEQALVDAVYHIFKTDNDNLTVNSARQHAADALDLDTDFFKVSPEWKDRSKDLIKELAVCVYPLMTRQWKKKNFILPSL